MIETDFYSCCFCCYNDRLSVIEHGKFFIEIFNLAIDAHTDGAERENSCGR